MLGHQTCGGNAMVRSLIVGPVMLALAFPAFGQQIFKCEDGKGGHAYQQTPCAKPAQTREVRAFTPERDSPNYYQDYVYDRQVQDARQAASTRQISQPAGRGGDGGLIRDPYAAPDLGSAPGYFDRKNARRSARAAATTSTQPTDNIGQPVDVFDPYSGRINHSQIKVAPNRVWDPKTGRYYDVVP